MADDAGTDATREVDSKHHPLSDATNNQRCSDVNQRCACLVARLIVVDRLLSRRQLLRAQRPLQKNACRTGGVEFERRVAELVATMNVAGK
ncbi:hypothetical protein [Mesorhizobium sp. Cs1299R1N3]|uniref:hypothetical protein n=1 Tax=Mesorhizobium sp. Cs1299R1N3 TaxID=3015173 RepID=UPI00301BF802